MADCCGMCFENCCRGCCEQGSSAASNKVSNWKPGSWFQSSLEAPPPLPPLFMEREAGLELASGDAEGERLRV